MKNKSNNRIKLGLFVLTGTVLLVLALYNLGSKRNLFSSTINAHSLFYDVNGLMAGNNVRYNGIDVGTITRIDFISDTMLDVKFTLTKKAAAFIPANATASIGSDGLLGSKLLNIEPSKNETGPITEGTLLNSQRLIKMDDEMRNLSKTNENLVFLSGNLKEITAKLNKGNSLWKLLSDSEMADNVRSSIVNIKMTSGRTAMITGDLQSITQGIKEGKGSLGALITDTAFSSRIKQIVVKMERFSDTAVSITGDISSITNKIRNGKGSIGILLNDTSFVGNLNKSAENIKTGSKGFSENMEALKHSVFLRKYFRNAEKQKAKDEKK